MIDPVIPRRVTHPGLAERAAGEAAESEDDEIPEEDEESGKDSDTEAHTR